MAPLVLPLVLPDDLQAFLDAEVARTGCGSASAYLAALLREVRARAAAARLEALLREGLAGAAEGGGSMAEADIARHHARYMAQGMPAIAQRFQAAVDRAAAVARDAPQSGVPRPLADPALADPALAGVRAWPLRGFDAFHVWSQVADGSVRVLRVLHDQRDIEAAI